MLPDQTKRLRIVWIIWFEIDERENNYEIDEMDKFSKECKRDFDKTMCWDVTKLLKTGE